MKDPSGKSADGSGARSPGAFLHPLPADRTVSAEEAAASRLFSSVRIGPILARTRTWVPAMVPWRATDDGFVTDRNIDWYRRFAAGLPGVLVVEATGIRDVPSGPLLRIGHDRFIPGLAKMVDAVRAESRGRTKFIVQIIDFLTIRRRPEPATFFEKYLVIDEGLRRRLAERCGDDRWIGADDREIRTRLSAADESEIAAVLSDRDQESLRMGFRERVTDLDRPAVRDLPRVLPGLFADAARRAQSAGFDGVELHFAHAYTMASFLSAKNTRTDGYGGSRRDRVRLALEVIDAVRSAVGRGFCVGCRYLGDEVIDGGNRIDDAVFFGLEFAGAGLDFLSISKGGKFEDAKQPMIGAAAYPYTGKSGHECMPTVRIDERGPFGRNLDLSHAIKSALNENGFTIPVIGAGGIATFDQAERALRDGDCDIVGAARQSLADPDWWRKIELGKNTTVRRCEFTNYCEGLDQKHKEVTCRLWDKLPSQEGESDVPMSIDGKRRLLPPRMM
jgi:2,4-dienoyl-CoA reductase-like NADH-dependent reductase (Old Yellow Enzyme family)